MTDKSTHASDCDWHVDQYPWECTCGLIARKKAMDELIALSADELYDNPANQARLSQITLKVDNELGDQIIAAYRQASYQRGKLEGARLALEAAATVAPNKTPSGECETVGQWTRRTLREAIRALDPAKIVGEG